MQPNGSLEEQLLLFTMARIGDAAFNRADGLTRLVVVEPDALGAQLRIDDVDFVTFADGFVRALGLASPAVDAIGRDVRGHDGAGNVGEHRPKSNALPAANERLAQGLAARLRSAAAMNRALALFGLIAMLGSAACSPTIGASCTQSTDCSSQGNRVCDTSQPEGYCTVFGCADGTCPDQAACVAFDVMLPGCQYNDYQAPARTSRALCLAHCRSNSDCRTAEGYVCVDPTASPFFGRVLDDPAYILASHSQMVCVVAPTPTDAGQGEGDVALCNAGRPIADAGAAGDSETADAPDAR
jgi:hypothetical protein